MCADPKAGGSAHFWCVIFVLASGEHGVKRIRVTFIPLASLWLCVALLAAGCSQESKEKTQKAIDDAKAAASDAADKAKQKASDAVNTAVQKASDKAQQT